MCSDGAVTPAKREKISRALRKLMKWNSSFSAISSMGNQSTLKLISDPRSGTNRSKCCSNALPSSMTQKVTHSTEEILPRTTSPSRKKSPIRDGASGVPSCPRSPPLSHTDASTDKEPIQRRLWKPPTENRDQAHTKHVV